MMTAAQNLQAMIARLEELMITDAQFSDVVLRNARREELSSIDSWRATLMARNVLRTWQTAHYMYRTGVLDKAIWEPQASLLSGLLQQDRGLQAHIKRERPSLDPIFVAYMDKLIDDAASFDAVPKAKPAPAPAPAAVSADPPSTSANS